MKKKIMTFAICIFFILLLNGCSVASEKEIIRFANEKYGEATLIRTEKIDDEEVVCYFKDKEYSFEYFVSSYMNDIVIDGATFGSTENKGSNFDITYYNYINDTIKGDIHDIEDKYNVNISISDGTYIYYFARISYNSNDTSNAALVSGEVSDLYTSIDSRHYWKDMVVEVYDCSGNYIGSYHSEQSAWMTPEEEIDLIYIDAIASLSSDAVYVGKEQHVFSETGVNINNVVQVLGNPEVKVDSIVTYYIFIVDDKEYYMCNFMITNDIGGYEWYTNYKK